MIKSTGNARPGVPLDVVISCQYVTCSFSLIHSSIAETGFGAGTRSVVAECSGIVGQLTSHQVEKWETCIKRLSGASGPNQPVSVQPGVLDVVSWSQQELSHQQLPNPSSSMSPFIPLISLLPALPQALYRAVRPWERARNSFIWGSASTTLRTKC